MLQAKRVAVVVPILTGATKPNVIADIKRAVMWSKRNKGWTRYRNDIIAADNKDAAFMMNYLQYLTIHAAYVTALEVYDLQRYKNITKPKLVSAALRERMQTPFVFLGCKN